MLGICGAASTAVVLDNNRVIPELSPGNYNMCPGCAPYHLLWLVLVIEADIIKRTGELNPGCTNANKLKTVTVPMQRVSSEPLLYNWRFAHENTDSVSTGACWYCWSYVYFVSGGEDACFVLEHEFGVFDGVGGWTAIGHDPGIFTRGFAEAVAGTIYWCASARFMYRLALRVAGV